MMPRSCLSVPSVSSSIILLLNSIFFISDINCLSLSFRHKCVVLWLAKNKDHLNQLFVTFPQHMYECGYTSDSPRLWMLQSHEGH